MPKDPLDSRKIVLALRRDDDIAFFQRFFDKSTSGWRYRCTGTCNPEGKRFVDFTPFRQRNPGKIRDALVRLRRLETDVPGASILSPLNHTGDEADRIALHFHADFLRFQAVNILIVQRHFAAPLPEPLIFNRFPQPYNLILALDLRSQADRAIENELPVIVETASRPGFTDDATTNAAGTLRALADMLARKGDQARQLDMLTLSQKLAPNAAKAGRIVGLLRKAGRPDEAERCLSQALLTWPRTPSLLALRTPAPAQQ